MRFALFTPLTVTMTLALAFGAAMAGEARAAPLTVTDRNTITDRYLEVVELILIAGDAWNAADAASALKTCEGSRDFAATFDPDDWAQGVIAGCFADVAVAQKDIAATCKLRDSQIAHYEKVMATGPEYLKKNLKRGLATAKETRAALTCP